MDDLKASFDAALADDLISVVSRHDEMGIFEVRIGDLETVITIELGRFMTSDSTRYWISHAIKTPTQNAAYWTSSPYSTSSGAALRKAIHGLTDYYRDAVKIGATPDETWLRGRSNA